MAKVTVIVPSRSERFLVKTVEDLLAKARGDIEVIVILEGYWEHALPSDPRVRILHHGAPLGMRPSINAAVQMSTGTHLLKSDAHCMWDEGFDVKLLADYHEDNWIVVPRRYPLDPEAWAFEARKDSKYPIDYHYLAEPFHAYGDSTAGLHGSEWRARREARKDILLDDEMSSQGSGYFLSRKHWDRIGPLDIATYGTFWLEFQEIGLKTWLSGGAVKVNKKTWYAHLYKGARYGRGYSTRDMGHENGTAFCSWFWMTDQPFPGRTRTMRWLLEHFLRQSGSIPTWPTDLDAVFRRASDEYRNPYAQQEPEMRIRIVSAKYGIGKKDGEYVDVTAQVAAIAHKRGLSIPKISNEALQVGAVFPGQRKRLWIEYTADGLAATADALERTSITLG